MSGSAVAVGLIVVGRRSICNVELSVVYKNMKWHVLVEERLSCSCWRKEPRHHLYNLSNTEVEMKGQQNSSVKASVKLKVRVMADPYLPSLDSKVDLSP
jgi:hypothetical protein